MQPGPVEACAQDPASLVGGYRSLRKSDRGRFANYVTPVPENLDRAALEHAAKNSCVWEKQASIMSEVCGLKRIRGVRIP